MLLVTIPGTFNLDISQVGQLTNMISGTFELTKELEMKPWLQSQSTDIYQAHFLCLEAKVEVVFSHGAYSFTGTRCILNNDV